MLPTLIVPPVTLSTITPIKGKSLRPILLPAPPRRLLLVKLSSLGDVIHALPLVESLRAAFPQTHIGWAVRKPFAPILTGNPNIDTVYTLEDKAPRTIWQFGQTLRCDGWDIALDAQGLLVSGIVTWLSGAPIRMGFDTNRENNQIFLTDATVPARQRTHMVERLMGFCDALGVPRLSPSPQTYLREAFHSEANALLAGIPLPCVGLIVGTSTPDKSWPLVRWVELATVLATQKMGVVLLGGVREKDMASEIQAAVRSMGNDPVRNLVGQTALPVLASVLAKLSVVVGGDTGPTHLAVAVGTPTIGLYGVSDPRRSGPHWMTNAVPTITLDYAEADAPPATRRSRHPAWPDTLSRIPATAVAEAVHQLCSRPQEGIA